MPSDPQKLTREERLAAKLRENLRRRKSQARELDGNADSTASDGAAQTLPKTGG